MDGARPTGPTSSYRSGAIEIDAMQRCVLIDGTPAKVGPRAFDVLLALVERRERVVPKPELMDLVWPRLVVEENNLLVHMVALRKLLGPRAIATIPGRGYRFVMPIDAVRSGESPESAPCPSRSAATCRPRRRCSVASRIWTSRMDSCANTRS
jgi:DNA-binding winged helix-turn-helix (wHTH) protein